MSQTPAILKPFLVIFAYAILIVASVQADGLIFRLPSDGTWCEYSGESVLECRFELSTKIADKMTDEAKKQWEELSRPIRQNTTIRLSSVGSDTRAQRPCRWIEITRDGEAIGLDDEPVRQNDIDRSATLKLLIPERYLVRGEDPLDHSILTSWNPKEGDIKNVPIEKGFNRIQYEIDRFRPVFPPPLRNVKRLSDETIETPVGTYRDCEVISGTSHFDRPTLNDSRWEYDSQWEIAIHSDAPYGVVRVRCEATGKEITRDLVTEAESNSVHTLSKIGEGATSRLTNEP